MIAYTQIVVLLKCISQFESLPLHRKAIPDNEPFEPTRIIGIERKKGYATYDLILLLVVFCHRFILKSLGLWKSEFSDDTVQEGLYKAEPMGKAESKSQLNGVDNGWVIQCFIENVRINNFIFQKFQDQI